jgi:ferredoxin-NADP reductase
MTSLTLLLWVVSGIVLQLAVYFGIWFWRKWKDTQVLTTPRLDLKVPEIQNSLSSINLSSASNSKDFRTFKVSHKVIEDGGKSICSFYLVPEDGQSLPSFLPGQYLTFRLDVPTKSGFTVQLVRCYSLSDAPHPDYYRVTIKRVPQPINRDVPPGLSSNYFHDQIVVGSKIILRGPSGHFHIDIDDFAPIVLIAGGIGFTPMLSMLNWCLSNQTDREVWLFYGVRNSQELVMKSYLEGLAKDHKNLHLWICFSNPITEDIVMRDYQHQGRIDISLLRAQLPLKPYHFYICGPNQMMENLVLALEEWGVPDSRIHFEAFGPASVKRQSTKELFDNAQTKTTESGIIVNFAATDKLLTWSPTSNSLLEFAEANGININSGCSAGNCGSCQTRILSGEVAYSQPPDFEPESGKCLLCVSIPKTNLTLDA